MSGAQITDPLYSTNPPEPVEEYTGEQITVPLHGWSFSGFPQGAGAYIRNAFRGGENFYPVFYHNTVNFLVTSVAVELLQNSRPEFRVLSTALINTQIVSSDSDFALPEEMCIGPDQYTETDNC